MDPTAAPATAAREHLRPHDIRRFVALVELVFAAQLQTWTKFGMFCEAELAKAVPTEVVA